MTELERIQVCLACPLAQCVEDLPLLRAQCPLVQITAAERQRAQATYARTQKGAARQSRYRRSAKGRATQRRYNQSFKGQVARMKYQLGNYD